MLPDFIVIGAQKAGSTFLVEMLRAHPDVYMEPSEVACFEDPEYEHGGVAALEKKLQRGAGALRVGFKRAGLLGRPECPVRIAAHVPQVQLIAILRNPVERAVSSLFNLMHASKVPLMPVDEAMPRLLDGSLQREIPASSIVLDWGLYHAHLQRYLQYFSRGQLLILFHDDLKTDASEVVRSIYRFLGVNERFTPPATGNRPMATPYSFARLRVAQLLHPLYTRLSADGTRRYARRGPIAAAMRHASIAVDRMIMAPLCRANSPALSRDVRQGLVDFYRDDVRALQQLTGRDLAHWLSA